MLEAGFTDTFTGGKMTRWIGNGLAVTKPGFEKSGGPALAFAGGEWRSSTEEFLSVDTVCGTKGARPGVGFASRDGKQR